MSEQTGNVATPVEVPLDHLVLDPALQCRVEISEEVVAEYAAAWKDGARFPPIRIVRVEERLLVVDGWHRVHAAIAAGAEGIAALVTDGEPREALLAAVQANSDHGLRRSQADKRRAVCALLQDPEWCQLSSRQLAQLVRVSHTHVDQVRRAYSIKRGEVLDEDRRCQVDGEWPAAWKALEVPSYCHAEVDRLRLARTPHELVQAAGNVGMTGTVFSRAFELRATELATEPWPWPEDTTPEAVAARAAGLDTEEDLLRAALARGDHLMPVYRVLSQMVRLPAMLLYGARDLLDAWEARPRLLEAARARVAELEAQAAARPKSPWEEAAAIHRAEDPEEQARLVEAANVRSLRENLHPQHLAPEVRDGVFAARVAPGERDPCPRPGCGGWVIPSRDEWHRKCAFCGESPTIWHQRMERAVVEVAPLLRHPGFGIEIDGVIVDAAALELLRRLRPAEHPDDVDAALEAWTAAPTPTRVFAVHQEEADGDAT